MGERVMTRIEGGCSKSNARELARLSIDEWHEWDVPPDGLTYEQWWAMEDARLLASANVVDPDLYGIVRAGRESAALHTIRQRWDDGSQREADQSIARHMWLMRRLPPEHPQHEEHEEYRRIVREPSQVIGWLRECRRAATADIIRQDARARDARSHALEWVGDGNMHGFARAHVKRSVRYLEGRA